MDANTYPGYMQQAIREAELAAEQNEVPVGAIVVFENKIIGRGHNQTSTFHDATAHAEIIALSAAYEHFGDWRLENCYLFSTLEPCPMCAGAIILSRIKALIYGARDPKFGACGSVTNLFSIGGWNHAVEVVGGVMDEPITLLMKEFFQKMRTNKTRVN